MQKKQSEKDIKNANLEKDIIEYYLLKKENEENQRKQNELKDKIISAMVDLQLNKKEANINSAEDEMYNKNITCTLYSPVSIDYNLENVKKDYPDFIEKKTELFLNSDEAIAAFKLKLKEFGLNKSQFKELIGLMDISKIETVNQTKIQAEYDKGKIEDISKYASIKEKSKYIKINEK